MIKLPVFTDMAKNPEQLKEESLPYDLQSHAQPIYPYGLCICLQDEQLDKLDLDGDCDVGDTIHFEAIATVTSTNATDTTEGVKRRIELQITHIAVGEEHEEAEEVVPPKKLGPESFYNK